jgi:nudix motif 8
MASNLRDFDDGERARIRARLQTTVLRRVSPVAARASVLVPLCRRGGRPAVLFTKRTETVGTHKGQVSFPGGRMDPYDVDEIACALRELEEELGVPPAAVEVLGAFHEVMSITAMRVTPVIAWVGDVEKLALRPAAAEIAAVFTLTLDELARPDQREIRQLGPRTIPVFTAGPHPVWGLTALILDEVMRDVLGIDLPLE